MAISQSDWLDIGNGWRSSVLCDDEQPTNYKALTIRPWASGGYRCYVNGEFRGHFPTKAEAKRRATAFATEQLA